MFQCFMFCFCFIFQKARFGLKEVFSYMFGGECTMEGRQILNSEGKQYGSTHALLIYAGNG